MANSVKKDQSKLDLLTDINILLMCKKLLEMEFVMPFIDM